jgi:hypothetical protein
MLKNLKFSFYIGGVYFGLLLSGNLFGIALTDSQKAALFSEIKADPRIPHLVVHDGCGARAAVVCAILIGKGLPCKFIQVNQAITIDTHLNPWGRVSWFHHVAAVVPYAEDNVAGSPEDQVFDASLFEHVVSQDTWLKRLVPSISEEKTAPTDSKEAKLDRTVAFRYADSFQSETIAEKAVYQDLGVLQKYQKENKRRAAALEIIVKTLGPYLSLPAAREIYRDLLTLDHSQAISDLSFNSPLFEQALDPAALNMLGALLNKYEEPDGADRDPSRIVWQTLYDGLQSDYEPLRIVCFVVVNRFISEPMLRFQAFLAVRVSMMRRVGNHNALAMLSLLLLKLGQPIKPTEGLSGSCAKVDPVPIEADALDPRVVLLSILPPKTLLPVVLFLGERDRPAASYLLSMIVERKLVCDIEIMHLFPAFLKAFSANIVSNTHS